MRRWISWVRPVWRPRAASRSVRVWVERGSMPYSAVIQPRPVLRRKGGTLSSTVARAEHMGVAEAGEARAFGVFGIAGLERDRAHLVGGAAGRARHAVSSLCDAARLVLRPCWVKPCRLTLAGPFTTFPRGMTQPVAKPIISELNERSREIFRMIVDAYVETGEPVGSRTLSRRGGLELSPATIRNVMADLEEAGLAVRAAYLGRDGCRPRRGCGSSSAGSWKSAA